MDLQGFTYGLALFFTHKKINIKLQKKIYKKINPTISNGISDLLL